MDAPTTRIILIGKPGVGKSSLGNALLGSCSFDSKISATVVTKEPRSKLSTLRRPGLFVVDTPGITSSVNLKTWHRSLALVAPGPHVFILTLSCTDRFTYDDEKALKRFQSIFGKNVMKHTVIVFTHHDYLSKFGMTIQDYVENAPQVLREMLLKTRYASVDCTRTDSNQINQLLEILRQTVEENDGLWYTREMYEQSRKTYKGFYDVAVGPIIASLESTIEIMKRNLQRARQENKEICQREDKAKAEYKRRVGKLLMNDLPQKVHCQRKFTIDRKSRISNKWS